MPKLSLVKGKTSYLARIFIQDSSSTTGGGLTGLTSGSSGLVCYRARDDDGNAAGTAITLSGGTRGTWSSGGFVEKDATNMPGVYEFGVPNAALATGSNSVLIMFKGATNMAPLPLEIELTGIDNQDAVRAGMTALPNAAAEAAGGLYTRGTGAGQINQPANGSIDSNTKTWNALTTVALPLVPTVAGRALDVSAGGEAGVDWANVGSPTTAVDLSGTTIKTTQKVDVDTIKTQAVTAAAGVTFPSSIASPTNITAGTITTATNLTNAPTAGDLTATMKTSVTTAATAATPTAAAVTGAVGSVTGAVGSVTGNVGGNVTGSVGSVVGAAGSVTGAVGSVTGNVGGNVTGSVGSVVGAVGSVTGNVGGNVTGSVGSLGATAKTDVKTQITDALNVDTYAEIGQEAPAATQTMRKMVAYLYKAFRNRSTQTSTAYKLYADNATTVDQKSTVSDDGTTFDSGEKASGP